MSYADEVYKATCRKILEEGYSDEGLDVRPHGLLFTVRVWSKD